jgi:hypothetical protein
MHDVYGILLPGCSNVRNAILGCYITTSGYGNIVYSVVPEHIATVNMSLAAVPKSIAVMNVF